MVILIYVTLSVTMQSVNLMNVVAPFGPTKIKDGLFDFVEGSIEISLGPFPLKKITAIIYPVV
jgi:hypothetical protein